MARWRLAAAALLIVVCAGSSAWAVAPHDHQAGEVRLPESNYAPEFRQVAPDEASRVLPGWDRFASTDGRGWLVAQYREDTGVPAALIGPGIELLSGYAPDAELAEAARRYAAEQSALLKADPSGLGAAEVIQLTGEKRYVIIQQVYEGLEVVGGRVDLAFDGGKLVFLGSQIHPGVRVSTSPSIDARAAQVAALQGIAFNAATDAFEEEPRLVVVPVVLETGPASFLAWEVKFTTADPVGWWWAYVDANDGQVLSRTNHAGAFDIPTTVTGDVNPNRWMDPAVETPLPDHRVSVNSTSHYTDENGFVNLPVPLDQPYTVTANISGRWANVTRNDGLPRASFSGEGTPGVPLSIYWTDENSHAGERDAYAAVQRIHKWLKQVDPSFTGMDFVCGTNVNVTSDVCNAFWNGSSINFYAAGGGCVNMATMADVVMHEYSHGITQRTYTPQQPPTNSGMGEAFSDMCAQTVTNDRYMGYGWQNGNGFIRDAENLRQYPGTECGGQVHCLGEMLMGASWKTRKNFIATYGYETGVALYDARIRAAIKTKQTTQPAFLNKLLIADDDNANLADGTPNWYEICDAFAIHNFTCPAITQFIFFEHDAVLDVEEVGAPITVTAYIEPQNCGALIPDSTRVFYSVDGGESWANILMGPEGGLNTFTVDLPGQPCGTLVSYYLRAVTTTGVTGTEPARAPEVAVNKFSVGPVTEALWDNYESDLGWTVGAPGDGATDGVWQRVDPVGKSNGGVTYQPENDHTSGGANVNCFVTNGSGGYYLNGDVDNGATTILSPTMDFSGSSGAARLDFWAFFQNDLVVDDTLRASVSNDNGATWTDLVKIYGKSVWNNWYNFYVYFSSDEIPFTNQMRFRFQAADYNSSLVEAAVDDVYITFTGCSGIDAVENPNVPVQFRVDASRPNPTSQGASIRLALPSASPVRVDIFDASGRLVRTVADGAMPAGYHDVNWDGKDGDGRAAASGVYWYRVTAGAEERSRKLLVVR